MDWMIAGSAKPSLDRWRGRGFNTGGGYRDGDRRDAWERVVAREGAGAPELAGPYARLAAAILGYRVFPGWLITPVLDRDPVEVGDTVGILCHLAPRVDLFFAARVVERVNERAGPLWRTGFTYRTLEGHPECGEESFLVEKDETDGRVIAALRSWSRPGLWYTRAASPFTRWMQVRASRAALDNLERVALDATRR